MKYIIYISNKLFKFDNKILIRITNSFSYINQIFSLDYLR